MSACLSDIVKKSAKIAPEGSLHSFTGELAVFSEISVSRTSGLCGILYGHDLPSVTKLRCKLQVCMLILSITILSQYIIYIYIIMILCFLYLLFKFQVNLMQNFKLSTSRDFRINTATVTNVVENAISSDDESMESDDEGHKKSDAENEKENNQGKVCFIIFKLYIQCQKELSV